ncbi:uncharacterized protein LOC111667049 isoform X1 [Seriola lalandi dorsalis]|uniref:Nucleoporin NUP42 n=2 Tax=Seriola TaxID=8160 RepID=A0A3B4W918_SERLL|nr:uncharacterized protein LOC111667049 isoform X1 [Seriola lalandi dorsalis]XP_023278386.1 uncharacterized protein LOC111667049 isoform X1 [Seriola lalandi dorsalis]XP_056243686.1 uncharacterized protein si:dkey-24l11.2 isoform X2 [Seriola aureovittata]
MENGEDGKTGESEPVPQTQQLCRFFSQGRYCSYGKKCKFLHVRDDASAHEKKTIRTFSQLDVTPPPANNTRAAPAAGRRPCRYFISGHCSMEDRCRFWHPPQIPTVDNMPVSGNQTRPAQRMPPVPRPSILQEVKLCDLTEDLANQLRDTEIKQLKKRFPKDQLIVQERSDGKLIYYRATVQATDPDWPFDLNEIDIMVSFPGNYPQEIFTLDIPLDQDLPPVMARHVQQASLDWLQAKHATNQLLGKIELLFRPFLRWLDRSLERLFTEGARQLKKDVDLEKAGLQFIPYQELQATVCEKSENDHSSDPASDTAAAADADEDASTEGKLEKRECERSMEGGKLLHPGCDEEQQQEEEEASHLVENIKISDPRRGTEVKVLGLRLGENTATVVAQQITVCLQCNRCKVTADLTLTGRTACTAQCEKCNASINAAFRPCMLHHYSDILGYLDLHNAAPADLVLQDCDLVLGCLSCSKECPVQNLSYGQTKEFNCEHCHSKLSILAESTRFQYIQPRTNKIGSSTVNYKTVRDPAVQKGKPLPEKGTCKHYKQSHRWLRFPCCGRAYPCDVCHDEDQDHPMELATRMICGYCAKEQPYGNGKSCISCGSMMTRGARSSHWEGGLGCRNKVKMSRNDRQKYVNTNKTVSRKAASEKK